jgi:uncharacterized protein YecT (DUF1311 family)
VRSLRANTDIPAKATLSNLRQSERAWIAFRDADCSYQAMWEYGGTGAGLIDVDCQYQMTVQRIKSLRQNPQ